MPQHSKSYATILKEGPRPPPPDTCTAGYKDEFPALQKPIKKLTQLTQATKKPPISQLTQATKTLVESKPILATEEQETKEQDRRFYLGDKCGMEEGTRVEFKQSFDARNAEVYRRTLNAFLNTEGGVIFFGIRDDGMVTGVHNDSKSADMFRLWVDDTQHKLFNPAVYTMTVHIEKLTADIGLWMISVPARASLSTPVSYQGVIYSRLNASTVIRTKDVDQDELQKLRQQLLHSQELLKMTKDERDLTVGQQNILIYRLDESEKSLKRANSEKDAIQKSMDRLSEQHTILSKMTQSLIAKVKPH